MTDFTTGARVRTHIDLCSGIGGFALAASWLGIRTVGFVEIDAFCQRVLESRFPEGRIHDDVKTFVGAVGNGWSSDHPLWLVTAGYPCQPFSLSGRRKGQEDDRHLWPHIIDIVVATRPAWCLFENVIGHISMGIDEVFTDLEGHGYSAGAIVIPAFAVGSPHRRDRVWIVAHSNSVGSQTKQWSIRFWEKDPAIDGGSAGGSMGGGAHQPALGATADGIPGWMAGDQWEGEIPRLTNRHKEYKQRIMALGNAIVPQVAYSIMRSMIASEREVMG